MTSSTVASFRTLQLIGLNGSIECGKYRSSEMNGKEEGAETDAYSEAKGLTREAIAVEEEVESR